MIITINADHEAVCNARTIKRGDDLVIQLVFTDDTKSPFLPVWDTIIYGGKLREDYSGDFLLYTDDFMPGVTPDGRPCLQSGIRLNSTALTGMIGTDDTITLSTEISLRRVGQTVTTNTLSLTIHNDLIKDTEGTEAGIVPEYATSRYVDEAIRNHLHIQKGEPGDTPSIGENGNWWIGGKDTYVQAVTDLTAYPRKDELPGLMDASGYTRAICLTQNEYDAIPSPSGNGLYFTTPS